MIRAIKFVGLIVLASLSFLGGCNDERKLVSPYRGADYFAGTDVGGVKDTVLAFRIGSVRNILQGQHTFVPVTKIAGKE